MVLLLALCCAAEEVRVFNIDPDGRASANAPNAAAKPGGLARVTLAQTGRIELAIGNAAVKITRRRGGELIFRIPDSVPEGCYVPLHVIAAGKLLVDSVPVSIARSGHCTPASFQPSNDWLKKKTGMVGRVHTKEWSLENGASAESVDAVAAFFDGDATTLEPGPLLRFPPRGLCSSGRRTYVRGTATIDILLPMLFHDVNGLELDAGDFLTLDDGRTQIRIPKAVGRSGLFWRTAASTKDNIRTLDTSANLHFRGRGGHDVGPLVATLKAPEEFEWLNRPASPVLSLKKDVPLKWEAAGPGTVLAAVVAVDPGESQFSYCLCVAPKQQQIALPARVLAGLVGSLGRNPEVGGALYLIHLPKAMSQFSSSELRTTAGIAIQMISSKVILKR